MIHNHTIVAISTGSGGAISVIRLSGEDSIEICNNFFKTKSGKELVASKGFTLHYGNIVDGNIAIDDVIVSVFRAPNSYTAENMIEISCHASGYIQQKIVELSVRNGAKVALGGDFTMRAYANGKLDLIQAEAVADLIASSSEASHRLALTQMRGGYVKEFSLLRSELVHLMSYMELELDFGEEDVQFADRTKLTSLLKHTKDKIKKLISSFQHGNAIKNGVAVVIAGEPNRGKSTLLNRLVNDDKAMVSPIAGTTRDVIEQSINIGSITFRFIDTAGLHKTEDILENMGIERTIKSVKNASLVLLLVGVEQSIEEIETQIADLKLDNWQSLVVLRNKIDIQVPKLSPNMVICNVQYPCFDISAKSDIGIENLKQYLVDKYSLDTNSNDVIISNVRHLELLELANNGLRRVLEGIDSDIPTDFLAQDLRETLYHIGLITGEISSDEILHNIFKNFCIGK